MVWTTWLRILGSVTVINCGNMPSVQSRGEDDTFNGAQLVLSTPPFALQMPHNRTMRTAEIPARFHKKFMLRHFSTPHLLGGWSLAPR